MSNVQEVITANIRRPKRKISQNSRYQEIMAYIFIAPPVLLFLIFTFFPILRAFYLSLTNYDILTPEKWVGLDNYKRLIGDELFFKTIKNIFYYVILYVPVMIIVSIGLAIALNKIRFATAFRTAYYLPAITSSIGAATVWMWLLNPEFGVVNQILGYAGITGPAWVANSSTAMISVVIVTVWQGIGNNMIIYLAGLQGIPKDLYESASLEGATKWKLFIYITLPALRPTTFFVMTMCLVNSFQLFDQAFALSSGTGSTAGGPGNSTLTPIYLIYTSGFNELQMGYASAMAFVMFLIILAVSLINMKVNDKKSSDWGS